MGSDPKRIEFQNKEDLIILLNLVIELTIKHYNRYKEYYNELLDMLVERLSNISGIEKHRITEKNIVEIIDKCLLIGKDEKNQKMFEINYLDYKSIEDKISNVQGQILNLLGDRTSKGGVSYWRFRDEYNKMVKKKIVELPSLMEFSDEFNKKMNDLYKARNYTHHMTDAKFIEWKNYRQMQLLEMNKNLFQGWPSEKIRIDRYKNVRIEWLWQLFLNQVEFKNEVKDVLMQMKKDYALLYGESIIISTQWNELMGISHFDVSINGYKRHLGKFK